jgi:hypothetical protein
MPYHRLPRRLLLHPPKRHRRFGATITAPFTPSTFLRPDPLIHHPARLYILAYLAVNRAPAAYVALRRWLHLTDGNLLTHLRKLTVAGYLSFNRVPGRERVKGPRTQARYGLTTAGGGALEQYLEEVGRLRAATCPHAIQ